LVSFPLCVVVGVLLFIEESCITPCIFSCRNWEWLGVENQKPIFF
jgi:hypothetical protein